MTPAGSRCCKKFQQNGDELTLLPRLTGNGQQEVVDVAAATDGQRATGRVDVADATDGQRATGIDGVAERG